MKGSRERRPPQSCAASAQSEDVLRCEHNAVDLAPRGESRALAVELLYLVPSRFAPSMPEPWTLAAVLAGRHPRHCEEDSWGWLQKREPPRVAYLAVARTGSESLQKAVGALHKRHAPHDHACTLRDVESAGATHVLISLRHPAERLASGV